MEILVKYGSQARGNSDSYSDSDFLIVGNIANSSRYYNSEIVIYSKSRLEKLKEYQSLFLIHLRDEGKILKDNNDWMYNFLKSIPDYIPSDAILKKAYINLSYVASIIPPISEVQCWFDMLFVFLRDVLIKLNARNNYYVFAPELLLDNLDLVNKQQIMSLINISRKIKSNYRNSIQQNLSITSIKISELLFETFNLDRVCINFQEIIKISNNLDPYLVLRLVEYGSRVGLFQLSDNKIERYIKKPYKYSWEIKSINWIDKVNFINHTPTN